MNLKSFRLCTFFSTLLILPALSPILSAQQSPPETTPPPSADAKPIDHGNPEFMKAADEVLHEMSNMLDLPIKEPLKKTLRSKSEIREYLIREEEEDKKPGEKYADQKALEAFGLIPKDFPLDKFMLDVLTDQVAGLYDPKQKEFYIADWIPVDEQRTVMAHELTHALVDQSFHLDEWIKAARPNDDAELARDSVSEGSAVAAMLDYSFLESKITVRDLPDITNYIRSSAVAEMEKDPLLSKAPIIVRDELLFPYLDGTNFTQQFLKANSGWKDFHKIFENPPVSTSQIIHPDRYLKGIKPAIVSLPKWAGLAPADWKLLEENVLGEFGLREVLKQFVGEEQAEKTAPTWDGDHYAVFEDAKSKQLTLIVRLHLDSTDDAALFFGRYSELLMSKYKKTTQLLRRPNFFQFRTETSKVFLRCESSDCVIVEGADRDFFDKLNRAINWPPAPTEADAAPKPTLTILPSSHKPNFGESTAGAGAIYNVYRFPN
jgi:hypothetical protein